MSTTNTDLRAYLRILWRWKLLFLAFVVLFPVGAYLIVSQEQKVYEASVLLQENTLPVNTSIVGTNTNVPAPSAVATSQSLAGLARLIETPGVARLAVGHLSTPMTASALLGSVSATADTNTGFIDVLAKASNPRLAAEIANAFGAAVVSLRTAQADGLIGTTISKLQAQMASLKPNDPSLHQMYIQLAQLRALLAAQNSNAQVLEAATPNDTPVSPKTSKAVLLGLIAGILLGLGAVSLAEALDRRIRHPEDLEELTGLRLLAVVPRTAFSSATPGGHGDEAFHMLRSALMFFNVDHPVSTVLVSSPLKGDGKTTVATRLAIAAAQAGRDVILIDADLRRPQASTRLGVGGDAVRPGHGLAGVLSGQSSLEDSLVPVETEPDDGADKALLPQELQGGLRVLPAGGTPPNPSELLASQRMKELLSQTAEMADMVIVDTNPLLSVSDSLPLFDAVSGVVLVARLNQTSKDALRRLQTTIAHTSAVVFGIVATDGAAGPFGGYGYGYGYYGYGTSYASTGNGNGHKTGLRARVPRFGRSGR
jgi:tyrosine-protein kinase